jgi:peptide/nickel transport system substrate-binding protein
MLLVAALGAVTACRPPPQASPPLLRIAHEVDVASLDPAAATDSIARSLLSNLYDSLVDVDAEMRLVPSLAVSWSAPEARVWVFRLRRGVAFHDGSRLTAADVRASLERARGAPGSPFKALLAGVEQVEALGELELRIRTRDPDPLLAARIANVFVAPARRPEGLARHPIGTGPYRFVARDGSVIELEAFASHWRGAPSVPRVLFSSVPPGPGTLRALAAGTVDVLRFVPESVVAQARGNPGFEIVGRPGLRALYLWMNSQAPAGGRRNPFADPRVRRAVSLALDRGAMLARFEGQGTAMNQMVPPGVFGHVSGLPPLAHDPAAARELLARAGYPTGFEVSMTHVAGTENLVADLGRSLAQVGIRVLPDRRAWPPMLADWRAARLPFFVGSWRFEYGEASLFFEECIRSRDPAAQAAWNAGFSSPELDRLIAELGTLFREEKRQARYASLMRQALEEMPLVPLVVRFDLYAVSTRVAWQPRLDGRLLAAEMTLR